MLINKILYVFFCIIAGSSIAAGFVAFIIMLGVFEKLATNFHAAKLAKRLETLTILGVTTATLIQLFEINLGLGVIGLFIFNLLGGIFIGCLAGALAETINLFPILSRRFGVRRLIPYILISASLGKMVGSLLQLLILDGVIKI